MLFFKKEKLPEKEEMLFSFKALVALTLPLLLQSILEVLVGTIDSVMVAYTGEAAVSGVSLINTLDTVLVIFFTAMVSGGSVVIAQALGRNEKKEIYESAKQLFYLTLFISALLTAIVLIFRTPLLNLLFGDVEAGVMSEAIGYFSYVTLSFPFLAINSSVSACFRTFGNSTLPLIVSIGAKLMNVGLNAWFIMGCGMGATGAGLATTISRGCSAVVLLIFLLQKKYPIHIEKLLHYKPNFKIIRKIMHIGVPNGLENTLFQFGRLLTQTLVATMGTSVIAANSVALTISNYQYMTGTACSTVMIAVVGRCIGAQKKEQAKFYSRKILFMSYALLWGVILGTILFLSPLVGMYNLSPESSDIAKTLILQHVALASVIWPLGFMLPSSFRATGDVRFPMMISVASMWIFRIVGAYLLALDTVSVFGLFTIPGLGMGISGVWLAMFIDWVFRCTVFFLHYLRGKWLNTKFQK